MKKSLYLEIESLDWVIISKYTYRSAKLKNIVCTLTKLQVQHLLDTLSANNQTDNHIVLEIEDTNGNTFYISMSDGKYRLATHVVEESW